MLKRILLGVLLSAMSWSGAMAQSAPEQMLEIQAKGRLEIGPDGKVVSHRLDTKLSPVVANALSKQIEAWQFEPIQVAGRAVAASTKWRVQLYAEPLAADSFRLTVGDVQFGEPEREHRLNPPTYPLNALRAGLGAKVMVVLKLDAEGRVQRAHARQVSLTQRGSENVAAQWRGVFARSTLTAVRAWRFKPGAQVNGRPIESEVMVPVVYSPARDQRGWQVYVPGPMVPTPWVDESSLAEARDLEEGEMLPLDSPFRLRHDPVGSVL